MNGPLLLLFYYRGHVLLFVFGYFQFPLPVGLDRSPVLLSLGKHRILALDGSIGNQLVLLQGIHLGLQLLDEFFPFLNEKK